MSSCLRRVQNKEEYYDNGMLKYHSKVTVYGAETDFDIYKKSVTEITEYYNNGQLELKQTSTERPAFHGINPSTMEPINIMPNKTREYKKYNRSGELVEEGKEKKGKSVIIQYNIETYKKIKTIRNQDWREPKIKYYDKYPARAPINKLKD